MKKTLILILIALIMLLMKPLLAEKRVYVTKPINPHPPVIDGLMNDVIWDKLEWSGDFLQRSPKEGAQPSQKTAFKITYDDNHIYFLIRAHDTEPSKVSKLLSRRDQMDGDWVEVNIDSYHDLRTAFTFTINAAGVKGDGTITNDGNNVDDSWDPIWYAKTSVDSEGWLAEIKIPFSQLRFPKKDVHIWGLQVDRMIYRKNEHSQWQHMPKKESGWVRQFGEIHGIHGINPKRILQIMPYSVGRHQTFEREDGNPFSTGRLSNMVGGLDGKIGITSNLTLDFTFNPDFGQVEADPSEVNLTAFESYFEEKRPFFIEGRNILNFKITGGGNPFAQDNLFYTRRIGRSPQHYPDLEDDEYADMPDSTTILGAFKLTGKTPGGLSIGVMNSITAKETGQIDFMGDRRTETVEPFTNYFVMRLQKDVNQGNTIFGGMLTATNRSLTDSHLDYLHKSAYTGGFDLSHNWQNKTYYVTLNMVFSQVRGSKEAILETQESSRRYFQRPDADHVELDPNRTSLSGHGGTFSIGKSSGKHWRYSTGLTWRSPGLELNDVGYMREADKSMQWIWVQYRITKPFFLFNEVYLNFNQWTGWNFNLDNLFSGGNINVHFNFKNHYGVGFGFNIENNGISTNILRGGPSMKLPGEYSQWFNLNSDRRKKLQFNFGVSNSWGWLNSYRRTSLWCGITFKPTNALSIGLSPSYTVRNNELQYVDTQSFGEVDRYLMGRMEQKTLSTTIRINLSLAPNLSIQFYGQPFVSAGQYTELKKVTSPKDDAYSNRFEAFTEDQLSYNADDEIYNIDENRDGVTDYSIDQPDYNFIQFRSNLVVRWEYTPGSTLFLVWSQGRTDYTTDGRFSYFNDLNDMFQIIPHNVFLIKFTYNLRN